MSKQYAPLLIAGLLFAGCGEELTEKMNVDGPVDAGVSADVAPDMGPLPFIPKADPIIPGEEQVFSVARARCQIVVDRYLGGDDAVGRHVWTYDDVGNMTLAEYDDAANGIVDRRVSRAFDGPDKLIREEDDRDGDGIPDTRVLVTYEDGGRVVSLHDADADDMPERRRELLYAEDLLMEEAWYEIEGDVRQSRITYTYGEGGRPSAAERYEGASESPTDRTTWSYDGLGRLLELGQDVGADGQIEHRTSYRYDDGTRTREGDTLDENGTIRGRVTDTFDAENQLTERRVDIGADGEVEQTTGYTYAGVLLMSVSESEAVGAGIETRFQYDRFGYLDRASSVRTPGGQGAEEVRDYTHHCRSAQTEGEPGE